MSGADAPNGRNTTRVRGLAPWQPRQATLELLETVRGVLAEYAAYLPLTVRQIFYRLVGAHGYPKDENAYGRLGEHLNRARRAGLLPFEAIRDDGADIRTTTGWNSPAEMIAAWLSEAEHFLLDRQVGQPRRRVLMVEAAGMKPQIETVASDYGVPVLASGGFDSLTAKYALARVLGSGEGETEVLHIGDYDQSGEHVFSSLAEDIAALIHDLGLPGKARFTRLAVTPQQVEALSLPTAPPKATDRRSFSGSATVQAEAIPPDVMAQIVRDAITSTLDQDALQARLTREQRIRRLLPTQLRALIDEAHHE